MFLINGCLSNSLIANDRAIQFGDGSFTTANITNGHVQLCDAHLRRLKDACKKLFIPFTQWEILQDEIYSITNRVDRGVLKIIISRGSSNSGYGTKKCLQPNRILSISSYPHYYEDLKKNGITLALSPIRLGRNPVLAGIKHLNRLEQVLIHIHLTHSGADEALVLDSNGKITECCTANLFWRKGNKVFTPRLDQAGVNGVMRQFCLSKLINSPFYVFEVNVGLQALKSADEVLICNALMPILPVRVYESKDWTSRKLYQFLSPLCEQAE